MAKIDVVIPCYKYGRFLQMCLQSVMTQPVKDLRVLIIDDASPDDSATIARHLAAGDSRIELRVHAKNQGHIKTYNEGIDWAQSDYFLLLSADDLLAPGALARAVTILDQQPDIVLTHGEGIFWQDDQPLPVFETDYPLDWTRQDLVADMCDIGQNLVATPTAIGRTRVQKAIGHYKAELPHSGDMEMWLRYGACGPVACIDAPQAIYRRHAANMSIGYDSQEKRDFPHRKAAFDSFFEACGGRLADVSSLQRKVSRTLADESFQRGVECLRQGRIEDGLELLRWAMKADPRLRYCPPLWRLFRMPGSEGRHRVLSAVRSGAKRLLGTRPETSARIRAERSEGAGAAPTDRQR
ncbi:Glycosyl transferase, group 2 family protein [Hyphomicrobiales bacterium]|nr:Glycosyl transferase, group 2 family protein [Hyphomicrobiales bacterium]CAH1699170.1 Glycosyl transferase, group 2 family protein [Hyphomicrobiales bacterium]CAI0342956.1 Glycosyltransferase [Hyphomicrobiales bacterium]